VFCCAHADQVVRHLEASKWGKPGGMRVLPVVSTNCLSAGEALRSIDQKDLVKGDFLLVSGDVVSNMDVGAALQEHRRRREKDANAILTMVMPSALSDTPRRRSTAAGLLARRAAWAPCPPAPHASRLRPPVGRLVWVRRSHSMIAGSTRTRDGSCDAVHKHLFTFGPGASAGWRAFSR
jgi:hypothetical protein